MGSGVVMACGKRIEPQGSRLEACPRRGEHTDALAAAPLDPCPCAAAALAIAAAAAAAAVAGVSPGRLQAVANASAPLDPAEWAHVRLDQMLIEPRPLRVLPGRGLCLTAAVVEHLLHPTRAPGAAVAAAAAAAALHPLEAAAWRRLVPDAACGA
eukprot:1158808-Pelagomonas_calceolata.AAC.7